MGCDLAIASSVATVLNQLTIAFYRLDGSSKSRLV